MLNGVIYARYSSHNQREESIEGQIRECEIFAERNDITITAQYIDRAISGKTDNRADFQRMIKDAEKGKFDVVIVYKMDRFARNRYDSATYKAKLRRNGVKVLSAKEAIPDGPEGIILESVLEGYAEYYSANLAQNITRGMTDNAMKCLSTGGGISLGYCVGPDKKYHIDEAGAEAVRLIFNMYDSGQTFSEIIKELNSRGIKTRRGGAFNKNSLGHILKNRRYIGVYMWKDIEIPDGMPVIIDKALFERVQKKMKQRNGGRSRAVSEDRFLLTSKLHCGQCGDFMVGDSGTGKTGQKFYYYTCSTKKNKHSCNKKSVRKDAIERLVVEETVNRILQDDQIQYIADKVLEYQERNRDNSMIPYYESQLMEINTSISNIMKAIEQGINSKTVGERMKALEADKAEAERNLTIEKSSVVQLTRDQIIFSLEQYKGGCVDDPEYRERIIDTFVNSVWLYDGKMVITYNYSGDKNKVTLETANSLIASESNACSDKGINAPPNNTHPNTIYILDSVFGIVCDITGKV